MSIHEMGRRFAARELSPIDVADAFLARIRERDDVLHAYITVTADAAGAAARASEKRYRAGTAVGALDGVPIGVKDLFDTAGIRTTANSRQYADRVPERDSIVVQRLRSAGAVLLGKHTMYEFASGTPALDALAPPAHNPWDTNLVPGGSSSGSAAAVAAGLATAAMGSDTGGSIRGPASYCGVVGFKPSNGLVSCDGVIPLAWTLDTVGPMTRCVEDAEIMLNVLADADTRSSMRRGAGPTPERSRGLHGVRVGVPIRVIKEAPDLNRETYAAFRTATSVLEALGATIVTIDLPEYEHVNVVGQSILVAEAFAFHETTLRTSPHLYGSNFRSRLLQGAMLTAGDYIQALRGRRLIREAMDSVMASVDLLATPTTPHPAWTFQEETGSSSWARTSFTRVFNITGQPAISILCGFSSSGLPIGLQLAARRHEDRFLLGIASAYEDRSAWNGQPTLLASH